MSSSYDRIFAKVQDVWDTTQPVFKWLFRVRIIMLLLFITVGVVLSVLYNREGVDSSGIKYTWETWFGSTGLIPIILELAQAIAITVLFTRLDRKASGVAAKVLAESLGDLRDSFPG